MWLLRVSELDLKPTFSIEPANLHVLPESLPKINDDDDKYEHEKMHAFVPVCV